jgi:hypothetical protein
MKTRPEVAAAVKSRMLMFYWEHKKTGRPIDFAKAPHVYKKDFAPDSPYNGNSLQFAFDVIPGYDHHELVTDTDRVTAGFHSMPDTDYEYAAAPTAAPNCGGCWRPACRAGTTSPARPAASSTKAQSKGGSASSSATATLRPTKSPSPGAS